MLNCIVLNMSIVILQPPAPSREARWNKFQVPVSKNQTKLTPKCFKLSKLESLDLCFWDLFGFFGFVSWFLSSSHSMRWDQVWAYSVSLAATQEIPIGLFSSGYWDVSLPQVRLPCLLCTQDHCPWRQRGSPIRKSPDQRLLSPPRSLSQTSTSFIAFSSLGIHRMLLFPIRKHKNHNFFARHTYYI